MYSGVKLTCQLPHALFYKKKKKSSDKETETKMDLRKEKSKPDQERTEPIRSDRAEVVSESKLQRTRSFAKINLLNQPYLSPGGMKTQSNMFLQQQTCDSMTKCNTKKKHIYIVF